MPARADGPRIWRGRGRIAMAEGKPHAVLSHIAGFNRTSLNHVDTLLTTHDGKKFVEVRDADSGETSLIEAGEAPSFCIDSTPDKKPGVAMERLLVGSQDLAYDLKLLTDLGVTHILNVAYGVPNAFPNDFQYLVKEMFDDYSEDFMKHYEECEKFIDEGRNNGGTVLVHCNAGRSRSATIALAYVMQKERVPLDEALLKLKQSRPACGPNLEFMRQLRQLETKLGIASSKST